MSLVIPGVGFTRPIGKGGFSPSQAQPVQPPSQGTQYNPNQGQPFGAWAPQGKPIHGPQQQPIGYASNWGPSSGQSQPGGGGQPQMGPGQWAPGGGPQMGPPQGSPPPGQQLAPALSPSQLGPRLPQQGQQLAPVLPPGQLGPRPPQPTAGPAPQFGQRQPLPQAQAPRPGGITQDQIMQRQFGDFWGQAQQMFPTMNSGQQQEMARFMKKQQESQNRNMLDAARQHSMNQWHANQAAAGANIKDIGPIRPPSRPPAAGGGSGASPPSRPAGSGQTGSEQQYQNQLNDMPPLVRQWYESDTGRYSGGKSPPMPPEVRQEYEQWVASRMGQGGMGLIMPSGGPVHPGPGPR